MIKISQRDNSSISVTLAGILYPLLKRYEIEFDKNGTFDVINKYESAITYKLRDFSDIHDLKWDDKFIRTLTLTISGSNGNDFKDIVKKIESILSLSKTSQFNESELIPLLVGVLFSVIKELDDIVENYNNGGIKETHFDELWVSYEKKILDKINKFSIDHKLRWDESKVKWIKTRIMTTCGKDFNDYVSVLQIMNIVNSSTNNIKIANNDIHNEAVTLAGILYTVLKKEIAMWKELILQHKNMEAYKQRNNTGVKTNYIIEKFVNSNGINVSSMSLSGLKAIVYSGILWDMDKQLDFNELVNYIEDAFSDME